MKTYLYKGPLSVTTIFTRTAAGREPRRITLRDGEKSELPEDHPLIRSLVARGRLVEVPAAVEPSAVSSSSSAVATNSESKSPREERRARGRRPDEQTVPTPDVPSTNEPTSQE